MLKDFARKGNGTDEITKSDAVKEKEEELGSEERRAARKVAQYLEDLRRFSLGIIMMLICKSFCNPSELTILDLAGADKVVASYAARASFARNLEACCNRAITPSCLHCAGGGS